MGTGLFIIDAIIIAIVILPFALFINGSKKRERKLKKALQSEATQNNCKLTKIEVDSNFAIGVDEVEEKLFFYKETSESAFAQVVDLKSIVSCKTIRDNKRVKDKTKHYDVIDKLQLSFVHHNLKEATDLMLYNNDDEMVLNNEIAIAQKWQDYVNHLLATKASSLENDKGMVMA
ncbi:hypothetical protein ADIWIN_0163 [Winogradskyella psychrotolerans RS-3]|uniref:Uncharacterized protein n=1 Tax=Winogradskyella psychrotolerans RS-3 TaxID=641526 RepID=S7X6V5_9FLAO|nr:hypothetical protein [Winogradskyella psychrotolerans]EPR74799.1 hypothetical protein ADIWIN_0163 [Winogradskyella psychrotolerans RS-3]